MSPTDSGMTDQGVVVDARAGMKGYYPDTEALSALQRGEAVDARAGMSFPKPPASGATIRSTPTAVIRVQAAGDGDDDGGDLRCHCGKYELSEADEAVVIGDDERHTVTECVTPAA